MTQNARRIALDQIESAAFCHDRPRLEYWADRLAALGPAAPEHDDGQEPDDDA